MKKSTIPLSVFLITAILCLSSQPYIPVFKGYKENSFHITPQSSGGSEISVQNEKGLIKKYTSLTMPPDCNIYQYDFTGDEKKEVCLSYKGDFEIIDFSPDIPLRISQSNDFAPIHIRFTKNEESVTGYLDNGQSFELFPDNINDTFSVTENAEISFTDYDNNNIYEICITQEIRNSKNEVLYYINTYRTSKGLNFPVKKITIMPIGFDPHKP